MVDWPVMTTAYYNNTVFAFIYIYILISILQSEDANKAKRLRRRQYT